jgi:hypothetical protein
MPVRPGDTKLEALNDYYIWLCKTNPYQRLAFVRGLLGGFVAKSYPEFFDRPEVNEFLEFLGPEEGGDPSMRESRWKTWIAANTNAWWAYGLNEANAPRQQTFIFANAVKGWISSNLSHGHQFEHFDKLAEELRPFVSIYFENEATRPGTPVHLENCGEWICINAITASDTGSNNGFGAEALNFPAGASIPPDATSGLGGTSILGQFQSSGVITWTPPARRIEALEAKLREKDLEIADLTAKLMDLRSWKPMTESPVDQRKVYVRRVRQGPAECEHDAPRLGHKDPAAWRFSGAYNGNSMSDWEWCYVPGDGPLEIPTATAQSLSLFAKRIKRCEWVIKEQEALIERLNAPGGLESPGWIIISKSRGPSKRPHVHESLELAKNEAERLALRFRGDTFWIAEITHTTALPVETKFWRVPIELVTEIPF